MVNTSSRRRSGPSPIRITTTLLTLAVLTGVTVVEVRAQTPAPLPPPANPTSGTGGQAADPPPPPPPTLPPAPNQGVVPTPSLPPVNPPFQFSIDPKTPLKDLLPITPKIKKSAGPVLDDDLTRVPEVQFEEPLKKDGDGLAARRHIAFQIAKINHLNVKKTDSFLEALRGDRADLAGLPMAMGDACRTRGERVAQFNLAVSTVRQAFSTQNGFVPPQPATSANSSSAQTQLQVSFQAPSRPAPALEQVNTADVFWDRYQALTLQEDRAQPGAERTLRQHITQARIAALMQMLAPTSASTRLGLVKHLATISHVDATRAIAKLAVFSPEEDIRQAAVDALKVRREKDYTDVLLQGLRYPWPAVARRASEVLVKLERADVVPQLIDALEEPDPRLPMVKEVNKKETTVVRELVRINHHRNCLLCHPPGNTANVPADALTAGVPVPGEPLPSPSQGYQNSVPEILVRIDVTYLRQDFSVLQAVEDANPWPEMQRFDYLVRTRTLDEDEAKVYRDKLGKTQRGQQSPYQRAVLYALRELTGKDAEPTPDAWRKLLGVEDKQTRTMTRR
jgi:hypothetical protein